MENDGITRVVGFSFRTDALVDEDIASEGELADPPAPPYPACF